MSRTGKPSYSVVITTYRRPRAAMAAALSVLKQEAAPQFELILVDNDPDGSALKAMRRLAETSRIPVRIVHERRIGLSSARNAGIAAARGAFVAFLDDDQIVSPRWLHHLARVQSAMEADIVYGAIYARLEAAGGRHRQFYEEFFSRDPDHHEGRIDQIYDCRCSLVRKRVLGGGAVFTLAGQDERDAIDPALVRLKAEGRKIAWAASAWVWQTPQAEQLSMRFALRAAYNVSREATVQALSAGPRRAARVVLSFSAGLAQAIAYAPVALALFCARSKRRAFAYRRFAEGMGRMLWLSTFRLRGPDLELIPVAR